MNVGIGDLCIVMHADSESNGLTCTVIAGSNFVELGRDWLCEFPRPVLGKRVDNGGPIRATLLHVPDTWLRRISGPPVGEDIETDNPIKHKEPV